MIKVYIAGPISKGDQFENVRTACAYADDVVALGLSPFVPHLFAFWHFMRPHEYEFWMQLDFEWLATCDVLLRIPGESSGADREVARAKELNLAVFHSTQELAEWVARQQSRVA